MILNSLLLIAFNNLFFKKIIYEYNYVEYVNFYKTILDIYMKYHLYPLITSIFINVH